LDFTENNSVEAYALFMQKRAIWVVRVKYLHRPQRQHNS
jgi:hypothetical protein